MKAARQHFAAHGFVRATVRGIAADAALDPSLINRYFGGKEELFAAAVAIDLTLPDLAGLARHDAGRVMAREFIERSESGVVHDVLRALLRSAASHAPAAERLEEFLLAAVRPGVDAFAPDRREVRAALIASQLLGAVSCRHTLALPGLAQLDSDALADHLAGGIQHCLTSPLERGGEGAGA
ncbi:TetR/AcrR family transcriptional regulator [Streptomyces purpurogeneiscleroticus]|uniref:TetR/AcrR family transcriptional regulator n=1 Tax=Streptomyces purpurogeneiscleroticus TaxID=68259 RepID=UPI0021D93E95|nr:TetR family transcriptional regulator [Streptomyces purpurogeneiscleroticus]